MCRFLLFLLLPIVVFSQNKVLVGADILLSGEINLIKGKRLGIVTNHSALLSNGAHLVDTLFNRKDITISALFGPEHGIRGDAPDGISITHGKDSKTGLPVYSLYGKINKPTKEMLKDVDLLIFDIQDVGARFYTFISTLFYLVQASAENNIPVIVLDRPNPISGNNVDGPVRKDELKSFVGIAPIPIMHGMTIGELAKMFNESGMIGKNLNANLTIIKMDGWNRSIYFDETKLKWIKPSPNIPDLETAIVYPGMCLIEGTNVSEGRGTYSPFLTIGAPFIKPIELLHELNMHNIRGVKIDSAEYTPVEIPNMVSKPKYQNQPCKGIKLTLTNRNEFKPVEFGIKLLYSLYKLYPDEFKFKDAGFDKRCGDKIIREQIQKGVLPEKIIAGWQREVNDFKEFRKQFLIY